MASDATGHTASWNRRCGLLAAVIAALLALTPSVERAELRTQDFRFRLRGPRTTHAKIVIAVIADSTLKAWDGPLLTWGSHYAAAIREARALGARWIGLDVIPAVSGGPNSDRALARAVAGGQVVLSNARPPGQAPVNPIPLLLFSRPEQPEEIGYIDAFPEPDGVARHASLFVPSPEGPVPSFPAVLALLLQARSPRDPRALRALSGPGSSPSIWINYVGPPPAFPYLPLESLAGGTLTPTERKALHGAVVLIGATYAGNNDVERGPGDRDYAGVELHAHALATLWDRRPLRRLPRGAEVGLVLLSGLLTAAITDALPLAAGGLVILLGGLAWFGAALAAFRVDQLWPVAGPLLSIGLAGVGQNGGRAMDEARRRRRLQSLFEQYVSRCVAEHLLRHPDHLRLEGVERVSTVLFLDLRGYTTAAQDQSPGTLLLALNQFFSRITPVVEAHDGVVLQYTGDGLLAVFGVCLDDPPASDREQHAQRALTATMEIVQLSRTTLSPSLPARVGCSLHSGLVAFGSRGGPGHLEYAVVGDTVNVAARLEELNKSPLLNQDFPSEIVISAATYQRLSDPPPVLGPVEFPIRGRRERLQVYQVRVSDE